MLAALAESDQGDSSWERRRQETLEIHLVTVTAELP